MILPKCTLLFVLILTLLLNPILGKRTSSHNYPRSGGLSGGGHRSGGLSGGSHGYPSSGGSHGYPSSGGSHSYPSSGGTHSYPSSGGTHSYPSSGGTHSYPSSGGTHSYPSSGGSNSYPSSGGNHGYPSSGGSHTYPSTGSNLGYPAGGKSGTSGGAHTYPSSNNNHGYPSSPRLSGTGHGYPANTAKKPVVHHTTHVYNNYHYTPPTQIRYISPRGGPAVNYPVYHGTPPTYVYQYKDSGSKYGTLLAGLALMNLGTLGVAAYAANKASQNHGSSYTYTPQKDEVCKFAIERDNREYEETRIDCQIISSFILQDMEDRKSTNHSTITTTTTVTNVTIVNTTNVGGNQMTTGAPVPGDVMYKMLPNGTLVPVNTTNNNLPSLPGAVTQNVTVTTVPSNNQGSSSVMVTTTTTNTTLVNALDVKGKPVEVTPGMQCFVIRITPISKMKKPLPCGLLQTYAEKSIRRSSAARNMPMFTIAAAILAYCVA